MLKFIHLSQRLLVNLMTTLRKLKLKLETSAMSQMMETLEMLEMLEMMKLRLDTLVRLEMI